VDAFLWQFIHPHLLLLQYRGQVNAPAINKFCRSNFSLLNIGKRYFFANEAGAKMPAKFGFSDANSE